MRHLRAFVISSIFTAAMIGQAVAVDVELSFSPPTNTMPKPITIIVDRPGVPQVSVPVMIPPGTPVMVKRNLVVAALNAAGITASAQPEPNKAKISGLPAGSSTRMVDGGTGEVQDGCSAPGVTVGVVAFPAFFPPFNYQNQPAVFTAGIVTDVGVLTEQVTATELEFQTEGPIICQALFQRLAPRAPQYGAQINYIGDRLEIYFDPAYTVTTGGVTFGTNSQGQGCQGGITIPLPPPPPIMGDMNGDGQVNGLDIPDFILAIFNPSLWAAQHPGQNILAGDFDGDGVVTLLDNPGFNQALLGH